MSSVWTASAGQSGTPSTGCRTAAGPEEAWPGVDEARPTGGRLLTKTTAEAWLDSTLAEARRGELVGMVRTGASFKDAAAEWLRYCEHERAVKPGTLAGYKSIVSVLNAEFGGSAIESFTPEFFERWKGGFAEKRKLSNPRRAALPRRPPLDLQAGDEGLRPAAQSAGHRRAPACGPQRRHRRVLPRGGHGARQVRPGRPRRRPLPHRRLHPACDSESCSGSAGRTSTSTPPRSASAATGQTAARAHPRAAVIAPSR